MSSPTQYLPFIAVCPSCVVDLVPLTDPSAWDTKPQQPNRGIPITFWCDLCTHSETFVYTLPRLTDDVSRNLMHYISYAINLKPSLLRSTITLSESNLIAQKGIELAIETLKKECLIYDVQGFSFKLTLLGKIMYWHGPY